EQRGEVGVLGVTGCGDDERREQGQEQRHREIRVRVSNGASLHRPVGIHAIRDGRGASSPW
ncbi:hypothetical protein, partial [Thiocapsa sp.]|uniref:hypothetical protein n=1 Tax=Thiocapsa sp. TaxID=2024551 RepID=UPI0035945AA4